MANLAIDVKSSVLPCADVIGVAALEPATELESKGVDAVSATEEPPFLAAVFAAFSASRFCFDADGGMIIGIQIKIDVVDDLLLSAPVE